MLCFEPVLHETVLMICLSTQTHAISIDKQSTLNSVRYIVTAEFACTINLNVSSYCRTCRTSVVNLFFIIFYNSCVYWHFGNYNVYISFSPISITRYIKRIFDVLFLYANSSITACQQYDL